MQELWEKRADLHVFVIDYFQTDGSIIVAHIVDTQFTLLIIHSSSQLLLKSRLTAHNTRLTIRLGAFIQGAFKGEVKQCFYWKMNQRCKGLEKPS